MFAGIIPAIPGVTGEGVGGGEFIDGGTGGGEFTVEDTDNPTGDCKSKYNGKCKGECASDKYSARCQDCIAVCGGGGGQPPGQCFSVGKDKSVKCGSTSNTCTGSAGKLVCKCGSNVPGNHVKNDRPFVMGGNRSCTDCTQYCKTGVAPKVLNGTTPGTVGYVPPGRTYPIKLNTNCIQVSASRYRWLSGGKSEEANGSCNNARSAWLKRYSSSGGGGSSPKPAPRPITSTLCKCGTGTASHVNGNCSNCKHKCSSQCGNCSPQCLGTRTNVGYYFDDAAEQYFDNGLRFANMAMAV